MLQCNRYKVLLFVVIAIASLSLAANSQAALSGNSNKATLSLSPQTDNYNIDDTFAVSIYLNANGQNIVGVSAFLSYDKNHFQALSIDAASSVFTMEWDKIIDGINGKIKITRTIPTPGVIVNNGLVAKINFKAVSNVTPASDNLTFDFGSSYSVKSQAILDDGMGTDVLSGVYNAKYQIGEGGPITYSDGALLKATGGTKVYVIDNSQKRWITTADIFNSNGYNWASVVEVAQSVLDSIATGPDMTAGSSIPEGGLIRVRGDIDVYIVKYVGSKKFKRLILSPSVFNSYGHLHWSDIKDVDQSVADSFITSSLVRAVSDPKVYQLFPSGDTGEKRWVMTQDAFTRLGLDWDSVYQINQVDRDSYITGAPIE